jgi:hypothetical protein
MHKCSKMEEHGRVWAKKVRWPMLASMREIEGLHLRAPEKMNRREWERGVDRRRSAPIGQSLRHRRSNNHSCIVDRRLFDYLPRQLLRHRSSLSHRQLLRCVKEVFFGFSGRKVEEAETKMSWLVIFFAKVMDQSSFN